MATTGVRRPLTVVVAASCSVVLLAGCGSAERAVADVEETQWPWEVHPPASAPSPTPLRTSGPITAPDRTPTDEPAASPTDDEADEDDDNSDEVAALEAEVITITDQVRADNGCDTALTVDDRLTVAAKGHSADMAAREYFDHTSPDGEGPGHRAEAAGYSAWGGENIAVGYPSAQAVVDGWMDSDGHRANILNCDFVAIGVGAVEADDGGYYWTQTFGWE